MRDATKMALRVLFVLLAVGTIAVSAASDEEEVKMVFHVEGMR